MLQFSDEELYLALAQQKCTVRFVEIKGLKKKMYNGEIGRALKSKDGERTTVLLPKKLKALSVKPENLLSKCNEKQQKLGHHWLTVLLRLIATKALTNRAASTWYIAYGQMHWYTGAGKGSFADTLSGIEAVSIFARILQHDPLLEKPHVISQILAALHQSLIQACSGDYSRSRVKENAYQLRGDLIAELIKKGILSAVSRIAYRYKSNESLVLLCADTVEIISAASMLTAVKKIVAASGTLIDEAFRIIDRFDERMKLLVDALDRLRSQSKEVSNLKTSMKRSKQAKKEKRGEVGGICGGCKQFFENVKMKKCSKCSLLYCSAECQKKDWEEGDHKYRCRRRQEEFKRFDGVDDEAKIMELQKWRKKRSEEAGELLGSRFGSVAMIAHIRRLDMRRCIIHCDAMSGVVQPMTYEETLKAYEESGGLDSDTRSILERNLSPQSVLMSSICTVESHPSSPHDEACERVVKSFPADQFFMVTAEECSREKADDLEEMSGFSKEYLLELLAKEGIQGVIAKWRNEGMLDVGCDEDNHYYDDGY